MRFTRLMLVAEQHSCSAAPHQRIYYRYPEDEPYSKLDQSQLETCFAKMDAAAIADPTITAAARDDRQEMISATRRWITRGFGSDGENMANRDRSILQTFEWLQNRFPSKHKAIVWAETVHIAK